MEEMIPVNREDQPNIDVDDATRFDGFDFLGFDIPKVTECNGLESDFNFDVDSLFRMEEATPPSQDDTLMQAMGSPSPELLVLQSASSGVAGTFLEPPSGNYLQSPSLLLQDDSLTTLESDGSDIILQSVPDIFLQPDSSECVLQSINVGTPLQQPSPDLAAAQPILQHDSEVQLYSEANLQLSVLSLQPLPPSQDQFISINSSLSAINPSLSTINSPSQSTINPSLSTINSPSQSTINPSLSTINPSLSTINPSLSTINNPSQSAINPTQSGSTTKPVVKVVLSSQSKCKTGPANSHSQTENNATQFPKKRGRKPKYVDGVRPRRVRPKKPKLYEQGPLNDERAEKKRQNAIIAKKHRDNEKMEKVTLKQQLQVTMDELDVMKKKFAVLQEWCKSKGYTVDNGSGIMGPF